MMRRKLGAALGVGVAAMLAIQDAGAWSESVRRAIASTAIQLIKREQPDAFKATTSIATHSTGRHEGADELRVDKR
jgi:hypothetical protein